MGKGERYKLPNKKQKLSRLYDRRRDKEIEKQRQREEADKDTERIHAMCTSYKKYTPQQKKFKIAKS